MKDAEEGNGTSTDECSAIPTLLSSFVDTFVDFSVSGIFLPPPPNPNPNPNTYYPTPDRLVALGDLHGDFHKSKEALRLAGLIDSSDKWSGGSSTLVQIGDVLDRGDDELKILYFLEKLKREAARAGGNVITMNGNHEIMNVDGDFRYVTEKGMDEFRIWCDWFRVGNSMKRLCKGLENPKDPLEGIPRFFPGVKEEALSGIRARIAALRPDGPVSARFLSKNVTVLVVGESVFVHGGMLAEHGNYGLERINQDVSDWICGLKGRFSPRFVRGRNSLVWLRKFSDELEAKCDCAALEHALATIPGVKRMIMGHTIQEIGINGVCNNRAIRIDVGMSKGCINGLPEVLEINGNSELKVLSSHPLYRQKYIPNLNPSASAAAAASSPSKEGLGLLIPEQGMKPVKVKA